MILPIATMLCFSFGDPLPAAIVEPVIIHRATDVSYERPANLAHPSERAHRERGATLEARKDWLSRRHMVALEKEVARAWDNPPVPMPQGPSMGPQPVIVNVMMPTPAPSYVPRGSSGIPARAGMPPPYFDMVYGSFLRRFADSGL